MSSRTGPLSQPTLASAPSAGWRQELSQRFDDWAAARHPSGASTRLTHRNVYILPTRIGWFFGVLLLVLLVLSINYQLNLGYLLTFLLAGSAMMAMHVTHNNLRGMQLVARPPEGQVHQGQSARLPLLLRGGSRDRWGLALRADRPAISAATAAKRRAIFGKRREKLSNSRPASINFLYADCAREGETSVTLSWTPAQRGLLPWPMMTVESRYPLGIWRAWSRWHPQGEFLVLPMVEHPAPPLPPASPGPGSGPVQQRGGSETEGVRPYRPGDSPRHVLWKKLARSDELVSRDTAQTQAQAALWLDFAALPSTLDTEARLSRLCAWVLAADSGGQPYGLRLGTQQVAPGAGAVHLAQCLRLLALHPGPLRAKPPATAQPAPDKRRTEAR